MTTPPTAIASLACSLVLAAGAAHGYPGAGPGPSTPKPRTGPALVSTVPMALPSVVGRLLAEAGVPVDGFGFHVRSVDAKAPFATLNQEQAFVMASTSKLVTTMAALDLLGPDHRWRTTAYARGPIADGRLDGDLLIVGGGNAVLTSQALRGWFAQLRGQGLGEIGGDIVLDRLAFALTLDDHAGAPAPEPERPHLALPDAFTLDEGVLRVELLPSPKGRASIRLDPPMAGMRVVDALGRGEGCATHAAVQGAPGPQRPDEIAPLRVQVVGMFGRDCAAQRMHLAPFGHAEFTARAVAGLWAEAGGRLAGRVVERLPAVDLASASRDGGGGGGGEEAPLSVLASPPLSAVVRELNKSSDNFIARNLMLTLAPGFPTRPATLAAARTRVRQWLRGQGLAEGDIEVDTGSGLSRAERGKPRALVDLLVRAWSGPTAKWLVDSLPVAGVDGTLANRMRDGPAAGRAMLKTGTLADTRALAGYVRARSGRVYAVAAMVNHPDAALAVPALDALIEWLAENG